MYLRASTTKRNKYGTKKKLWHIDLSNEKDVPYSPLIVISDSTSM